MHVHGAHGAHWGADATRGSPGYLLSRGCQKHGEFPLMKYIRQYASLIILVFVWWKSIHFWQRYARKTIFTFSFPLTLTFDL